MQTTQTESTIKATPEQLKAEIFEVLSKLSDTPVNKIKMTDHLSHDLSLDSLKRMEALSRISDKYNLDPDLESAMEIETVEHVINLMEKYL